MRVTRITSKNYRTLEDLALHFPSNYCTISGHNNAGKSCVIRLLSYLLYENNSAPWIVADIAISYQHDKTQWLRDTPDIVITYDMVLSCAEDTALISFIGRLSKEDYLEDVNLLIRLAFDQNNIRSVEISVNGKLLEPIVSQDVLDKLKSSTSLFLHNSTQDQTQFYLRRGRATVMYDFPLSAEDKASIAEVEQKLHNQLKRVAKSQTTELNEMLGKLNDKYDVELTTLDISSSRRMPLTINLTDRNVEVPLLEWGSGTQNRTRILMSVLQANRIKTREKLDERITPIVVIEEPESFLHPSAQAEFGKVLQALSEELKIQIIVSTHSPYMLNQVHPASNILMRRKVQRKKALQTELVNVEGENWMVPYAEHLGVIPPEFESWRKILTTSGSHVLLVEGSTDKEYIEYARANFPDVFRLPENVEVVSYDGKNALTNTIMMKFILSKLDRYYITFDLDAAVEVKKALERIGLVEGENFCAVGQNRPGRQAIEGLVPDRILSTVHARETELVLSLGSTSAEERKSAKSRLKKAILEEFKRNNDYSEGELKPLASLGKVIAKAFV